jgi:hypothetical protein
MTESKMQKYTGGCHCSAVRFEVEMDLGTVIICNCSYCSMRGTLLAFVNADKFKLLTGEDNLTTYQFNKKVIEHLFCKTCGVQAFGKGKNKDGSNGMAINVRCLDGVNLETLTIVPFDGKSY